jgi:hypothetical protein
MWPGWLDEMKGTAVNAAMVVGGNEDPLTTTLRNLSFSAWMLIALLHSVENGATKIRGPVPSLTFYSSSKLGQAPLQTAEPVPNTYGATVTLKVRSWVAPLLSVTRKENVLGPT